MPQQVPSNSDKVNKLSQLIRQFDSAYQKFKKADFYADNSNGYYFILSAQWLHDWKQSVSYDQLAKQPPIANDSDDQIEEQQHKMPPINSDIINDKFVPTSKLGAHPFLNVALKPGLQQTKDYVFLTEQLWDLLIDYGYEGIQVKRFIVDSKDGKKVELYYQQITISPVTNQILKDYEYQRRSTLLTFTFQASRYTTTKNLVEFIKSYIKKILSYNYTSYLSSTMPVRLWLAEEKTKKNILYNTLRQSCAANSTFNYKIFFQGQLLYKDEENDEDFLEDTPTYPTLIELQSPITENSLLIIEIKQRNNQFSLYNHKNYPTSECSYCRKTNVLKFMCSCKSMIYCSRDCLLRDRTYHQGRCPTNAESDKEDQEQENQVLSLQKAKGGVGLRNLGNTCFMNSGLQCLAHNKELTEYFLSNAYLADINKENVLGTQGQLCTAYAKMVKNLWIGKQSSFSPTQLKRAIGKFQPMFSGYDQHDSGQLITYLLDGLHQDLNRVIKKPYVETKDYDGRADQIVAKQQWNNFLLRNQSEIVDLMYGQYRSVVDCPNCQYRSIQFDPFCMCSLPIINNSLKRMEVVYLEKHMVMKKFQISFDKMWGWKMSNILEEVRKKTNKPDSRLISYVASYATCEIIDQDRLANQVRSEYKYRTIFVRELEDDQQPKSVDTVRFCLGHTICHSYYKDQSYRKSISQFRLYFVNGNMKLKELHHKIFNYYKDLLPFSLIENPNSQIQKSSGLSESLINFYKQKILIEQQQSEEQKTNVDNVQTKKEENKNDDDIDSWSDGEKEAQTLIKPKTRISSEQPVRLLAIPTSRYSKCEYCGVKGCQGCLIPYSENITIRQYVQELYNKSKRDKDKYHHFYSDHEKEKKKDEVPTAQFEIYYRKNSSIVEQSFTQLNQGKRVIKKIDNSSSSKSQDGETIIEMGNMDSPRTKPNKPTTSADTSLADCFKLFQESETLGEDNQWYCPKCKQFVQAKKQMQIYKAPKIFIICLKRFKRKQYYQEKYNILVDFPINDLDISPYIIHSQLPSGHIDDENMANVEIENKEGPVLYDLFGITNHFGGTGGGHYTAYCKHPITGQWFDCDDSYVRQLSNTNQLVSEGAYILFYRRKQNQ